MLCHACESKLFPDHVTPTRGVKELVLTDPRILSGSSKFNQILGDTFYSGQEPCGPVLTSKVLEYLGENEVTVDEYLETLGSNALDPQIVKLGEMLEQDHVSPTRCFDITSNIVIS
jgi:hypothetical protein